MPKYRMIHVDHYMSRPVQPFDDLKSQISTKPVNKVPIIRIFGIDVEGRKICIHVHGFYPYIAIQNRDPNNPDIVKRIVGDIERSLSEQADTNRQRQQQASNREQNPRAEDDAPRPPIQPPPTEVLEQDGDSNLVFKLHQDRPQLFHLSADQRSPIHRIESIEAFNYYGYHYKTEPFLKIHFYNPRMVKHLALLFEDCKVLGRFIPVFWAHLPYILLFFIDNNLRGMQFIEVDQLYWRRDKVPRTQTPVSPNGEQSSFTGNNTERDCDYEAFTTDIDPISSCELEADIRFEWILNRQRFGSKGNDDALRELWLDDQEASQGTRVIDPKLPLFDLERNYIQQLCDSYQINFDELNLELTDRPRASQLQPNQELLGDSDESAEFILQDREDHFNELSPENPAQLLSPKAGQSIEPRPTDADEFSDDDDFLRNFPKIEEKVKKEKVAPFSPQPGCSKTLLNTHDDVKPKIERTSTVDLGVEPNISSVDTKPLVKQEHSEDEFSDDDQFLMEAVIKAETQDPALKSQRIAMKSTRRGVSDNSMIDGISVLCSTAKRSKTGSQRSTSSTRETVSHEFQYLTLMSMELHATTRGKLRPDPMFDPIESIFYCIRNDAPDTSSKSSQIIGMIMTDIFKDDTQNPSSPASSPNNAQSPGARSNMSFAQKIRTLLHKTGLSLKDIEINLVDSELELIMNLVEIVKLYDPEILLGYEMEQLSWGYVLERASVLNLNVGSPLSRVIDPNLSHNSKVVESNFAQPLVFTGRLVFSTWRIIRHEISLNTCSYERVHHHALNERIPCFSFETLTRWFTENRNRWRVIDYYLIRAVGQMRILDKFDLIAKVSELARVYGTQFIDVITRGSQIGIESMMLRLAKLRNMIPLSPTVMQRNKMRAPESLPLVMEPETNIYYDPVAVLDFQSLYPSVGIAYNYCYSTCLGRVIDLESKTRFNFGCSQLHIGEDEMKRLIESNSIHVSPCGVAFVKKNIRHGILPKMLTELILTRAMVKDQMKKNMKSDRPNKRLQRILDHRQHGLKMMANTTFGYTGASYTGRMPCVDIADSTVSKGRETLENAIELVESRPEWGAKVIYGDTDSIFIQFQNCDKDTAFKRAYEMVDAITAANPYPIKMKFEKIYQPCVLQTKKRYCGFKYETPEQVKPEFEAKGIETIRRDCCPAAARMLEMALRIQFTTRNIDEVKRYVQHQFVKIMSGKLSNIQDFIFARQYKPRDYDKSESVFVPAWQITKRLLATDPRIEPRLNERVPFVIVYGEPKTPLVNLAKTPIELLDNLSYRINADYYIRKIICPTLNRVFCTMKVDTLLWYSSMPHQNIIHRSHHLFAQKDLHFGGAQAARKHHHHHHHHHHHQSTMSQYFSPSHCPVCAKAIPINDDLCDSCRQDLQSTVIRLTEEISKNQRKLFACHQICRACSSLERNDEQTHGEHYNPCISYDCQNLFRYHQAKLDALNSNFLSQVLKSIN